MVKNASFYNDVIDHTPEWSDEGSNEPKKFTALWLSRISELYKFNVLVNDIKAQLRKDVDMLK